MKIKICVVALGRASSVTDILQNCFFLIDFFTYSGDGICDCHFLEYRVYVSVPRELKKKRSLGNEL